MQKKKKCFVIAPIGEDDSPVRKRSDQILTHVIKPAAQNFGYDVDRADNISKPGIITEQIIERLYIDDLVIADLTGNNPNVTYELALRHAFKKPIIQIQDSSDSLPFDIAGIRTIRLDYRYIDSMERGKQEIINQIKNIEKDPSKIVSPVTFALDYISAIGKGDPQSKVIFNMSSQIDFISRKLADIESRLPGPQVSPHIPGSALTSGFTEWPKIDWSQSFLSAPLQKKFVRIPVINPNTGETEYVVTTAQDAKQSP